MLLGGTQESWWKEIQIKISQEEFSGKRLQEQLSRSRRLERGGQQLCDRPPNVEEQVQSGHQIIPTGRHGNTETVETDPKLAALLAHQDSITSRRISCDLLPSSKQEPNQQPLSTHSPRSDSGSHRSLFHPSTLPAQSCSPTISLRRFHPSPPFWQR